MFCFWLIYSKPDLRNCFFAFNCFHPVCCSLAKFIENHSTADDFQRFRFHKKKLFLAFSIRHWERRHKASPSTEAWTNGQRFDAKIEQFTIEPAGRETEPHRRYVGADIEGQRRAGEEQKQRRCQSDRREWSQKAWTKKIRNRAALGGVGEEYGPRPHALRLGLQRFNRGRRDKRFDATRVVRFINPTPATQLRSSAVQGKRTKRSKWQRFKWKDSQKDQENGEQMNILLVDDNLSNDNFNRKLFTTVL